MCPITADHISATCQCPSVPAVSAHPRHLPVPISDTSVPHFSAYQCTSMPHICGHLSCLSVSPISAPVSATYKYLSVPPISATYQCQSVPPISAHQCRLSVPVSAAYQCRLTVPVSAT
ncbi:unnamed protein product [Staurois parvus]|uniref:Uncharacterized protein n=2 Tax=Staurois parvus TaxID=386267 RepID=A0ABN9FUW2_9NEOB|nr:unnamed protein product [Staurois parvus]